MATGFTTRVATLAILLLVFVAGLAVGVAVDRQVAAAADAPPPAPPVLTERPADPEEREDGDDPPRERRMMIERVGLAPDQKLQVDSIVAVMGSLMSDLQKDYRKRYWAVVDSTRASLRQTLSPEQAVMYDSLVAKNDQRRRSDPVPLPRN
jgi:hypothetical protein